jgi:hypothetical protein
VDNLNAQPSNLPMPMLMQSIKSRVGADYSGNGHVSDQCIFQHVHEASIQHAALSKASQVEQHKRRICGKLRLVLLQIYACSQATRT